MKEKEFYKEEIIKMVQRIDNVDFLHFVHRVIKNLIG